MSPDCFTGTLSAVQAADAMRAGWLSTRPGDDVVSLPVSDGGPGFLAAMCNAFGANRIPVIVCDPLGRPTPAEFALLDEQAWIESALACGLQLLEPSEFDPGKATSYGVGQLISAAIEAGAKQITVGVGGTACNDAGAGMWAALGATSEGADLSQGGLALRLVTGIDLTPALAKVKDVEIILATDVDNPLLGGRGATATYAKQKGADDELIMRLEVALRDFSSLVGKRADGKDAAVALGAGSG
ncbi:MAG: glycerate kinase, partial [Actinomycetales bacterium]|nr:glycerate kinase [Actinomycetales bacterium]